MHNNHLHNTDGGGKEMVKSRRVEVYRWTGEPCT